MQEQKSSQLNQLWCEVDEDREGPLDLVALKAMGNLDLLGFNRKEWMKAPIHTLTKTIQPT